jgi:hypothetical protein
LCEYQRLATLLPVLIQHSPTFLSAERLRLVGEFGAFSREALATKLDELRSQIATTSESDPSLATLTLQAALARMELLTRTVRNGEPFDWQEQSVQYDKLDAEMQELTARIRSLRQKAQDETLTIRRLRKERLVLT